MVAAIGNGAAFSKGRDEIRKSWLPVRLMTCQVPVRADGKSASVYNAVLHRGIYGYGLQAGRRRRKKDECLSWSVSSMGIGERTVVPHHPRPRLGGHTEEVSVKKSAASEPVPEPAPTGSPV